MSRIGKVINTTAGLIILLALITLFGAFLFRKIEGPAEVRTRVKATKTKQRIFLLAQQLAEQGPNADWTKLVTQVEKYRTRLRQAWKSGNDEIDAAVKPPTWSFRGAIYYCITLFTTIGYGNVFPSTNLGRISTIIFGLITIPLFSLIVTRISKVVARLFKAVHLMTQESSGIPVGLRDAYAKADSIFDFSLLTCLGIIVIYIAFSGLIYCWIVGVTAKDWSQLDAVYFSFISMTSIGLGDILPTSETFLNIISLTYIIIGLILMNLIFGRIVEIMEDKLTSLSRSEPVSAQLTVTGKFSREKTSNLSTATKF